MGSGRRKGSPYLGTISDVVLPWKTWEDLRADRWTARNPRERETGGRHTINEWEALLIFFGEKCLDCGSEDELTKDHVLPLKLGGLDEAINLQPLCRSCNSRKGARWIDHRTEFPALVMSSPVREPSEATNYVSGE